jgi:hypothetical protein
MDDTEIGSQEVARPDHLVALDHAVADLPLLRRAAGEEASLQSWPRWRRACGRKRRGTPILATAKRSLLHVDSEARLNAD